jgi:hypothetical protein
MTTRTPDQVGEAALKAPEVEFKLRPNRLLTVVALFAIVVGAFSALGGLGGAIYTYQQAAVEGITTPDDAVIAEAPVRGPMTLWAQSEVITRHQLDRTEGMRYAQMERMVPMVDEDGAAVLGEDGQPVMVPNQARLSWIDATSLTTVLGLGILSYAFSAFAFVMGLAMVGIGLVLFKLRRGLVAID